MRTAPAARFTLAAGRAPRVLAAGVAAFAVGGVVARVALEVAWGGAASLAAAVAAAVPVLLVPSMCGGRSAVFLRWDGGIWHLALDAHAIETPGDLSVIVDLGPWLLLRFDAASPAPPHWLIARRGRVAPRWHALRCAVYSPRPAAPPDASVEEAAL